MDTAAKPAKNSNSLLSTFRKWHSWGGLFLSVFILTVAVTGILLNHKDVFFHGEKKAEKEHSGLLTASTDLAALPIGFFDALRIAGEHYGEDTALEKIELKDEGDRLMYKVAQGGGKEVRIDARTGELFSKYGVKIKDGKGNEVSQAGWNWAKIVDDLHTGKILGTPGKLTVDFTSGVIILLTLSGIYLWGAPLLRKRQNAANRREKRSADDDSAVEAERKARRREEILRAARKKPQPVAQTTAAD